MPWGCDCYPAELWLSACYENIDDINDKCKYGQRKYYSESKSKQFQGYDCKNSYDAERNQRFNNVFHDPHSFTKIYKSGKLIIPFISHFSDNIYVNIALMSYKQSMQFHHTRKPALYAVRATASTTLKTSSSVLKHPKLNLTTPCLRVPKTLWAAGEQ